MEREPAPALVRGLHLLRLIAADPATLEELVRGTAIPRSSLARMLEALAIAGVAARDDRKRWRSLVRVEPAEPEHGLDPWLPLLGRTVAAIGLRAELWRFDAAGPALVDAAEPPGWPLRMFAYPGWRPDRRELFGPTILWWGLAAPGPAPRAWHWHGRRRTWLGAARVRALADAARLAGMASCPAPIHNRSLRHAVALPGGVGALVAVSLGPAAGIAERLRAVLSAR